MEAFFSRIFQLPKMRLFPSTKRLVRVAFILGGVIFAVRHDSGSR